jgi:dUTP pyrophosphatase
MKPVTIPCVYEEGFAPRYASTHAAGADLQAFLLEPVIIPAGEYRLIPTGVHMAIPEGMEGQIRPRSGLALKHGMTVLNAPGTIDSDYRGEIKVTLINHGKGPFTVNRGDRIAQIVIAPIAAGYFEKADSLEDSPRGTGGFGSTG